MAFTFPSKPNRPPQRLQMFVDMAERIPAHDTRLASAIKKMVTAYRDIHDDQARFERDQTITPGARLVKLAKAARSKVVPLMEEYEAATTHIAERQNYLRGEIAKVYNPPGKSIETVMRHQEVRALFRAMPRADALKALEAARGGGDEDTLIALASVQPMLSGLPPQMHQHSRDHLIEKYAPEQAAAVKDLSEQVGLCEIFQSEMATSVAALIDFAKADEIMAAARIDAAE